MRIGFRYICLFIILVPSFVYCSIVSGRITSYDNKPIAGATVRLIEPLYPITGTTTDVNGCFYLSGLAKGEYLLQVSYIGYWNKKASFSVSNDSDKINLDIKLSPGIIKLDSVAEIENYHKYFSALKPKEILEIHLDSLVYSKTTLKDNSFSYVFSIHSTLTNKTDKPIYVLANLPCFTLAKPFIHNSKGEEMKANMYMIDCMEKDLPDSSDFLVIPPHASIKYQPSGPGFFNFAYYPKDNYSVRLVYEYKRLDRLPGIYSDPERNYKKIYQKQIYYFNMAFRGKFISVNELNFDNHEISMVK